MPAHSREIKITGKYIIFPVSNSGQRGRMTISVGEQLVHNLDCDFPPDPDSIDWWTYLDMSEYVGKTAKVVAQAEPEICEMFESSDDIRHLMPLYDEALRPQFHISQMRGWNNDPNGMCYYDGQYHFFWQCNPIKETAGRLGKMDRITQEMGKGFAHNFQPLFIDCFQVSEMCILPALFQYDSYQV